MRLPRRIGLANAKLMSFTGRTFTCDDAVGMGLVDLAVPLADLGATADSLAREIAANSADSVRKQKKMYDFGFQTTQREALAWVDDVHG